jgi:hypothetical protein
MRRYLVLGFLGRNHEYETCRNLHTLWYKRRSGGEKTSKPGCFADPNKLQVKHNKSMKWYQIAIRAQYIGIAPW